MTDFQAMAARANGELIGEICRDYATLVCAGRILDRQRRRSGAGCRWAAIRIYNGSPIEALKDLDTIKRILEIDANQTNPTAVMLQAGFKIIPKGN